MKQTRWGLGLLSALALLLTASQDANALWPFCHGCHGCDMHICCKQYNAFTPVCFGNVHCIGCCPPSCGMPGGCGMPGPICSALGPMSGCCDPQFGMGMPMGMPMGGMPMQPNFQMPVSLPGQPPMMMMPPGAPMPQGGPAPNGNLPPILNRTAQYGNPMAYPAYGYGYGVQPAGYYGYPNAYGAYPGYGYNPYMGYPMPNYGYGAYGQQQQQQRPY